MADRADLERRLLAVFNDVMNLPVASARTDLLAENILDSLAFVDLLLHLENCFGVTVDFDDLDVESFRTVAAIAALIAP